MPQVLAKSLAKFLLISSIVSSIHSISYALTEDRNQPLQINANSVVFNEKNGNASYQGNVIIRQGTLEIRAQEVTIQTDPDGRIISTQAKGNLASYQQKTDASKAPVMAEAAEIFYDVKNEKIQLKGKAWLRQENASFKGNLINYDSKSQQVDAKGDAQNRVQLILPPQLRTRNSTGNKSK